MRHFPGSRTFAAALCAWALILAALALPTAPIEAHGKGHRPEWAWRVLAPISYKNLTIFPVAGPDERGSDAYITLDEGTKSGGVVITEKGGAAQRAQARSPRGEARQQSVNYSGGGGATVNELSLINRSGKKLLLLAGEVVVGGKQDRIVQEDRIIPPVSVPVALNVFCVEHGRWSAREASHRSAPEASAPAKFSSLGAVAHPKLRGVAQDKKAQGEVWSEVSKNNAKLGTSNGTDTYQEVYSSKQVGAQMEDYVRALESEVLQPGVIGVVVARNGKPVWADVFASRRLFASYWPKLLKSYVVDALGEQTSDKRPTVEEAARYLHRREGAVSHTTQAGVYQLVKTEQAHFAVFELLDISLTKSLRLHYNKMDR